MKRIFVPFVRVLGMFAILSFVTVPLRADPITISQGPPTVGFADGGRSDEPLEGVRDIIEICNPFMVGRTNANGMLTMPFRNATGSTILDFHFFTDGFQGQPWTGNGMPFFDNFTSSNRRIDFVTGGTVTGMAPTAVFAVTFTNFTPNTIIRGHATVPEPATLLLLGTGLAGVAMKMRKRLKSRKSGQGDQ